MGQKKGFRSVPIISISILVTVAMAAIWFSPVVESSNQTQLSTEPAISMNVASVNGRDYVNNTIWNLLAAESQASGQSAQYKLDSAFINWYVSNVNALPSNSKNLTQQNISSIFRSFMISDRSGQGLVQNLANSEPSTDALATTVNVTNVVSNREGTIIHSSTTYSSGSVKYLLTYKYTENGTSITYTTIRSNNVTTPVDPYVEESASGIYVPVLWWQVLVGVSYNSYLLFFNQQNAVNFKNFLISDLTGAAIFDNIMTGLFFTMIGVTVGATVWGLLTGLIEDLASDLLGTTSPTSVANNVNTLFNNQWGTEGLFDVSYTLDNYITGTPEYAVWGPIIGGSINLFGSFDPIPSANSANNYIIAFDDFANEYGENTWVYFNVPPSWTTFFGYEL